MSMTIIQRLASIDVGTLVEVKARKGFKDPDFTPVGPSGSSATTAVIRGKQGTKVVLEFALRHQAPLLFTYDAAKDVVVKSLTKTITKEDVIKTKTDLAALAPNPLITFMLFFVSVFSKTPTKTQFRVRSQSLVEGTIEGLRGIIQGLPTVDGATYVIWKTEDGTAKGGFNLATWAGMTPATEWALVREENLPYIVAGTGGRGLKYAAQPVKDRAIARVTAALEALKAQYGDRLRVMSGMAEGFDELMAMIAIRLGIKLILAIPNKSYGSYYWCLCPDETERNFRLAGTPRNTRIRGSLTGTNRMGHFNGIINKAKEDGGQVIHVMEDVHGVTRGLRINGRHSNFIRNDFMVAQGNHFLVWDPSSSGTSDCFASIREAKKSFEILSTDADSTPEPRLATAPVPTSGAGMGNGRSLAHMQAPADPSDAV